MSDYLDLPLNSEQLTRLNFETSVDSNEYSDIDGTFHVEEVGYNTFQQFVYDTQDNKFKIGTYLKTVGDIMTRYKSFTGYDLKYWDKEYPQTGQ